MILAQDGSGPSTKIEDGYTAGYLDGAILSTKSRNPDTLSQVITASLSRHPTKELFLDNHFYASQLSMTSPGRIPDYQLFTPGLTRKDFSIKGISNYVRRLIDHQKELGLINIIIPSLTIANFDDYTSQISLQMYEASLDYIQEIGASNETKVYMSLVFHEAALRDNEKLSQYLDEITLFDNVEGFYIVVERDNANTPQWQDNRTLGKLLYVVNTLADNYKVMCGFMDFPGLLMLAAGATHVASGWHRTLRQYTGGYFMYSRGRNNGTFRYACPTLLTQLQSIPDLQTIIQRGFGGTYVDSTYGIGHLEDPHNLVFPPDIKVLHQWKIFAELGTAITQAPDRLAKMEELINTADSNVESLRQAGVLLDRSSISHYDAWKQAIRTLRTGVL